MTPLLTALALMAAAVIGCGRAARPQLRPVQQPISFSFVDAQHGWVLGLPHCKTAICHSIAVAATTDDGKTWRPITAPTTDPTRLHGIVFANQRDGWVYGPSLFSTHDGGTTWQRDQTSGAVLDLVPSGPTVRALEAVCDRTNTYCQKQVVMSAPISGGSWAPLRIQPHWKTPGHLARYGSHAWIFYTTFNNDQYREHMLGTDDNGVHWRSLPDPCLGATYSSGLATLDGHDLWLICPGEPGMGQQQPPR